MTPLNQKSTGSIVPFIYVCIAVPLLLVNIFTPTTNHLSLAISCSALMVLNFASALWNLRPSSNAKRFGWLCLGLFLGLIFPAAAHISYLIS